MKKRSIITTFAFLLVMTCSYGQKNKKEVVMSEFKTSAVCGMCKKTLESEILYEKGVQKSELDVATKMFKVWYRADKTNEEQLRIAISEIGYDADSVKADPKAYDRLNPCCKKDAHQEGMVHE